MSDVKESKFRLIVAWLSWLFMLSGGVMLAVSIIIFSAFFFIEGWEFVANVLAGQEKNSPESTRIILASALGVPAGAWSGIWLWAKLMRKTGFISDERVRKMSSYSKPSVG
jgi:hypothetical protein